MRNLVKFIYIFMLAAILAVFAFGSCGKDNGNGVSNTKTPTHTLSP